MSYDLAVWEADLPADDASAGEEFRRLYERDFHSRMPQSPTPRITAYVDALLDRYPDIDVDDENSLWADSPLIGDASGPLLYFPMAWSQCEEVAPWAAQLAQQHGLACYDPQIGKLRP
jgi:hypothetical protein